MNKRFLIIASAILGACILMILAFNLGNSLDDEVRVTDQDFIKARKAMDGDVRLETTPARTQLDPSRPVRLAVGSLGLHAMVDRQVGDLIVTELSGMRDNLVLVERQALDKVLQEANLSLSGLVRAKDAVRVGKLLQVDWFLLGTESSSNDKKAVVARIVDAHSGIMRDITVINHDDDPVRFAKKIAEFVRQSRYAEAENKPRVFLAVGAFTDVSVNNRLVELASQFRSGLTSVYRNSNVTLLEREHVNALLQEVRLDLAGLTDDSSVNREVMQSAMWLVDGYYQSFETSDLQVDMVVRVNRIFGRTEVLSLRAPAGEALLRKMKDSIDQVLAKPRQSVLIPTRRSEINAQLNVGKDLLDPNVNSLSGFLRHGVQFGNAGRPTAKDKYVLEEAIRAFQTVLLLDPENSQAKVYLAACLRRDLVGRTEEARNYYQEVIASPVKDQWTKIALFALAGTYYWSDPEEAARLYREAGAVEEAKQALDRMSSFEEMSENKMQTAEDRLFEGTRRADEGLKGGGSILNAGAGMRSFVDFFRTNRAEAAIQLAARMPKLKEAFPDIVPHMLAAAVRNQVDTNAPVIAEFQRSLQDTVAHPENVTNAQYFFDDLLEETYEWCMENSMYSLAVELCEAKRQAEEKGFRSPFDHSEEDKLKLGFAYRGLERWKEAMEVFECFKNKPIDTGFLGSKWANPFLPSKAVKECREKLGLPLFEDPFQFDLGGPWLHLHSGAALVGDGRPLTNRPGHQYIVEYDKGSFAVDGEDLWVAQGTNLFRLNLALKTNLQIALSKNANTHISALQIGPEKIWIGTQGEGLIEFDKASHESRRFTVQDGLLLNTISSIHLNDQSLWIGYGDRDTGANYIAGGLGIMNLQTHRFASFSPPLSTQGPEVVSNPPDGPPRNLVLSIASGKSNDLWMVAHRKGLQLYRASANSWSTLKHGLANPYCLVSDGESLFVGLNIQQRKYDKAAKGTRSPDTLNGGVAIRSSRDDRVRGLGVEQGLPAPQVTALAVNGSDLWIGGRGYVAVADLKQNKVRKVSYVQTRSVDRIEVGGGYVWVQFDGHLYRASLKGL